MTIEAELTELLTALDAFSEHLEQWNVAPGSPGGGPSGTGSGRSGPVSGESPDAQEERSIRGAAASLARTRARRMREELGALRNGPVARPSGRARPIGLHGREGRARR